MKTTAKIMLIILLAITSYQCTSYVPTTEKKAKKVMRKLDLQSKANTQRIKAIANTYNLATTVPTMVKGTLSLPEIKISAPVSFPVQKSGNYDSLLNRYTELAGRMATSLDDEGKERMRNEINQLRQMLYNQTYGEQSFTYEDDSLKADFKLDPGSADPFTFTYIIKPRDIDAELPGETMVVDAGKEYYQFWQFWVLLGLLIFVAGFFIYVTQIARN